MLCHDMVTPSWWPIVVGRGAGEQKWWSSDSGRSNKDALTCKSCRAMGLSFFFPVRALGVSKNSPRTSGDRYPSMNSVVKLEHKEVDAIPFQEASLDIWDKKYRLSAKDGTPVDKTMDDTYKRVARALADVEH